MVFLLRWPHSLWKHHTTTCSYASCHRARTTVNSYWRRQDTPVIQHLAKRREAHDINAGWTRAIRSCSERNGFFCGKGVGGGHAVSSSFHLPLLWMSQRSVHIGTTRNDTSSSSTFSTPKKHSHRFFTTSSSSAIPSPPRRPCRVGEKRKHHTKIKRAVKKATTTLSAAKRPTVPPPPPSLDLFHQHMDALERRKEERQWRWLHFQLQRFRRCQRWLGRLPVVWHPPFHAERVSSSSSSPSTDSPMYSSLPFFAFSPSSSFLALQEVPQEVKWRLVAMGILERKLLLRQFRDAEVVERSTSSPSSPPPSSSSEVSPNLPSTRSFSPSSSSSFAASLGSPLISIPPTQYTVRGSVGRPRKRKRVWQGTHNVCSSPTLSTVALRTQGVPLVAPFSSLLPISNFTMEDTTTQHPPHAENAVATQKEAKEGEVPWDCRRDTHSDPTEAGAIHITDDVVNRGEPRGHPEQKKEILEETVVEEDEEEEVEGVLLAPDFSDQVQSITGIHLGVARSIPCTAERKALASSVTEDRTTGGGVSSSSSATASCSTSCTMSSTPFRARTRSVSVGSLPPTVGSVILSLQHTVVPRLLHRLPNFYIFGISTSSPASAGVAGARGDGKRRGMKKATEMPVLCSTPLSTFLQQHLRWDVESQQLVLRRRRTRSTPPSDSSSSPFPLSSIPPTREAPPPPSPSPSFPSLGEETTSPTLPPPLQEAEAAEHTFLWQSYELNPFDAYRLSILASSSSEADGGGGVRLYFLFPFAGGTVPGQSGTERWMDTSLARGGLEGGEDEVIDPSGWLELHSQAMAPHKSSAFTEVVGSRMGCALWTQFFSPFAFDTTVVDFPARTSTTTTTTAAFAEVRPAWTPIREKRLQVKLVIDDEEELMKDGEGEKNKRWPSTRGEGDEKKWDPHQQQVEGYTTGMLRTSRGAERSCEVGRMGGEETREQGVGEMKRWDGLSFIPPIYQKKGKGNRKKRKQLDKEQEAKEKKAHLEEVLELLHFDARQPSSSPIASVTTVTDDPAPKDSTTESIQKGSVLPPPPLPLAVPSSVVLSDATPLLIAGMKTFAEKRARALRAAVPLLSPTTTTHDTLLRSGDDGESAITASPSSTENGEGHTTAPLKNKEEEKKSEGLKVLSCPPAEMDKAFHTRCIDTATPSSRVERSLSFPVWVATRRAVEDTWRALTVPLLSVSPMTPVSSSSAAAASFSGPPTTTKTTRPMEVAAVVSSSRSLPTWWWRRPHALSSSPSSPSSLDGPALPPTYMEVAMHVTERLMLPLLRQPFRASSSCFFSVRTTWTAEEKSEDALLPYASCTTTTKGKLTETYSMGPTKRKEVSSQKEEPNDINMKGVRNDASHRAHLAPTIDGNKERTEPEGRAPELGSGKLWKVQEWISFFLSRAQMTTSWTEGPHPHSYTSSSFSPSTTTSPSLWNAQRCRELLLAPGLFTIVRPPRVIPREDGEEAEEERRFPLSSSTTTPPHQKEREEKKTTTLSSFSSFPNPGREKPKRFLGAPEVYLEDEDDEILLVHDKAFIEQVLLPMMWTYATCFQRSTTSAEVVSSSSSSFSHAPTETSAPAAPQDTNEAEPISTASFSTAASRCSTKEQQEQAPTWPFYTLKDAKAVARHWRVLQQQWTMLQEKEEGEDEGEPCGAAFSSPSSMVSSSCRSGILEENKKHPHETWKNDTSVWKEFTAGTGVSEMEAATECNPLGKSTWWTRPASTVTPLSHSLVPRKEKDEEKEDGPFHLSTTTSSDGGVEGPPYGFPLRLQKRRPTRRKLKDVGSTLPIPMKPGSSSHASHPSSSSSSSLLPISKRDTPHFPHGSIREETTTVRNESEAGDHEGGGGILPVDGFLLWATTVPGTAAPLVARHRGGDREEEEANKAVPRGGNVQEKAGRGICDARRHGETPHLRASPPPQEEEEKRRTSRGWEKKTGIRQEMPVKDRVRFLHYLGSHREYFDILHGGGRTFFFFC